MVPIIQSIAQLEKNYGKEGSEIIIDNTQVDPVWRFRAQQRDGRGDVQGAGQPDGAFRQCQPEQP